MESQGQCCYGVVDTASRYGSEPNLVVTVLVNYQYYVCVFCLVGLCLPGWIACKRFHGTAEHFYSKEKTKFLYNKIANRHPKRAK